ncbi:hypothetical protein [Sneathiella sp.]|uniref:hypothetical protein n=1 Tax=Sneathiella sp. TaxID=1964365 RepID=UPI00260D751C|nr:hypothetical protein [Sneathiella sp.]MDF2368869.1 hypothetical protein [Sneathiella sp.]
MNDDRKDKSRPSYEAFHVQEGKDDKAYFHKIGSAFAHKDGNGHDIHLQSLPLDFKGRITIRTPKERLEAKKQGIEHQDRNNPIRER